MDLLIPVQVVLALLVVEKIITKEQADKLLRKTETNTLRGVPPTTDFNNLIKLFEETE